MSIEFESLFRSAPHPYLVVSPELQVLDVNACYLHTLSAKRHALVGHQAVDVIPLLLRDSRGDVAAELRLSLEGVLRQRQSDSIGLRSYELLHATGVRALRTMRMCNTPLLDRDGSVTSILHSIEDHGDQVPHAGALQHVGAQASERRYAELLDAAPDAIIAVGPDGRIELVNEQTVRLFGYTRDELVGAALECLMPKRVRERHASHVQNFFARPVPRPMAVGLELVACRKDGSEFPIEVSLNPIHNERGISVSAAIRDISQRKRTEAEARLNAERFASAMEAMHDAFAVFDADDRLVRCNAAYRRLLAPAGLHPTVGMKREQLLDSWLSLLDPASVPDTVGWRANWLSAAHDQMTSLDLRTRDQRSLRVTGHPTGQGDFVEVVWDLTDDEQRAAELRLARVEAEAASTAKSEFLSSMSHELRTPMNSILGFAQLLARDSKEPLSPRHRERVGHILQSGEHLLRLIDDVLDLARVESGRIPVSSEPVDLRDVLRELVRTLAPMASERSVHLESKALAPDFPLILCDRVRLLQILMNFGSNAIKYNHPHGLVTFSAVARGTCIRVQVEDTGMGIAVDQQSKLFQAFQRAGQEAGPIEGTGIGLLITKKLAELMSGSVGFESTPLQGSAFWVELPLSAAGTGAHEPSVRPVSNAPVASATRGLVLYVEDNPANIAFMCDLFEDLEGMKLVTARSAAEGLMLTRSLHPQVILMDINLPDMSGSQTLQALQQSPNTARIPVIALTAAASERDRRAGLQAGFYRYLTKPLDVEQLMTALDSALRHASGTRQSSHPPPYIR
jgi:PAS domain S-box-containing protein